MKRKNSSILLESPVNSELEDSLNSNGKRTKSESKTFSNSKRAKIMGSEDDGLLSDDDDYLSTDEEINKFHIRQFGDSFLSSNEDELDDGNRGNSSNSNNNLKKPVTRSSSSKNSNNDNYVKFKNNLKKIKNLNELEDVDDELDNQIPHI